MVRKLYHKLSLDRPRSARQNQDPVRRTHRLRKIMGDQNRRLFPASDDRTNVITDRKPRLIIQSRKRFIKKQKIRLQSKSPDQSSPLPHPTGKLRRMRVIKILEPVRIQKPLHPAQMLRITLPPHLKPQRNIRKDRPPLKQMIPLQHVPDPRSPLPDRNPVQPNLPPLRNQKPGKQRKQRRLPTSRRSHNTKKLAGIHMKRYIRKGLRLSLHCMVGIIHPSNFQFRSHGHLTQKYLL